MNIGKQSTLNDLQAIDKRIDNESSKLSVRISAFEGSNVGASSSYDFFQPTNALFNGTGFNSSPENGFFNALRVTHRGGRFAVSVFSQSHTTLDPYISFSSRNLSGEDESITHQKILTDRNTVIDANGFVKKA